ncbi:hypothetical protein RJP21_18490 [Paenibacillus sp. VCA1]|uniref:hypothetical protein n=1 Tax=Paenibacillus sp. VCA1 TaxID=3039148 RepID=UPI0028714FAC|nr:hypothetical protein [Paenibacillus sp. VCA1]MDR9855605.1 hypothetical protein [Paenibacillus sp. VCA1]
MHYTNIKRFRTDCIEIIIRFFELQWTTEKKGTDARKPGMVYLLLSESKATDRALKTARGDVMEYARPLFLMI